jgi:hypothetical protein
LSLDQWLQRPLIGKLVFGPEVQRLLIGKLFFGPEVQRLLIGKLFFGPEVQRPATDRKACLCTGGTEAAHR